MTRHLVLGNGESRAWFNPSEKLSFKWKTSNDVTTWGCNAIHRDGHVDERDRHRDDRDRHRILRF